MVPTKNFKELSFLVYGLGLSGKSVINYFKKNKIKNFEVWDDKNKNLHKKIRSLNLKKSLKKVDYIILSPGVSLQKSKYKEILNKYKKKIITDIDLVFMAKNDFKTITYEIPCSMQDNPGEFANMIKTLETAFEMQRSLLELAKNIKADPNKINPYQITELGKQWYEQFNQFEERS